MDRAPFGKSAGAVGFNEGIIMKYAKAVVGAAVAGLTALGTAMVDDNITGSEWVGVAVAFFAALGLVWAIPNKTTA